MNLLRVKISHGFMRKTNYIGYHLLWNLKKNHTHKKQHNDTNELISKTEIDHRHRKQTYAYQRRAVEERDKLGIWD